MYLRGVSALLHTMEQSRAAQTVSTFAVVGPTTAAWREEALRKVEELDGLQKWILARNASGAAPTLLADSINRHLNAARETAGGGDPDRGLMKPAHREAQGFIRRANARKPRCGGGGCCWSGPTGLRAGQMPNLMAQVRRFLPKDDPRRLWMDELAGDPGRQIDETARSTIISTYHAANSQRRRELLRVRSFRNVIYMTFGLLMLVALGVALLGLVRPDALPLCFAPDTARVCPTGAAPTSSDLWLIEVVGLVAAAVGGAASLRNIRGTSTPYSLPVALALLKLPTGALTAILGLLLMRGEFVPGLSALDSSAQIVSWAVVFGYSQQLFTRLIDQQASSVLQDVGGRGAGGDRPTSSH